MGLFPASAVRACCSWHPRFIRVKLFVRSIKEIMLIPADVIAFSHIACKRTKGGNTSWLMNVFVSVPWWWRLLLWPQSFNYLPNHSPMENWRIPSLSTIFRCSSFQETAVSLCSHHFLFFLWQSAHFPPGENVFLVCSLTALDIQTAKLQHGDALDPGWGNYPGWLRCFLIWLFQFRTQETHLWSCKGLSRSSTRTLWKKFSFYFRNHPKWREWTGYSIPASANPASLWCFMQKSHRGKRGKRSNSPTRQSSFFCSVFWRQFVSLWRICGFLSK